MIIIDHFNMSKRTGYTFITDSTMRVSQVVKGEMSAKTTYQKSAKGPVSISECAPDGKFIVLENSGRKVCNTIH
jgi:intermediate filament protein if